MKSINFSTTDLLSIMAAIMSAIALIVSARSCQVSQDALNVSVLEYNNTRALVLKGVVQNNNADIQISPLDPAFLLQEAHYQFPSEFGTGRKYASAPNHLLHLSEEITHFEKLLVKRYQGQGRVIGENARMPFLIEAYSSVKGESFRSTSIYTLNFKFEVSSDPQQKSVITLTGITFGTRIERGENSKALLEKEWKEAQKNCNVEPHGVYHRICG